MPLKSQLQGILDSLPLGALVLDRDRRVVLSNDALEKLSGLQSAEILGKHVSEIFIEDNETSSPLALTEQLARLAGEVSLVGKTGRQIPVRIDTRQVLLDNESHHVLSINDMTHIEAPDHASSILEKEAEQLKQLRLSIMRNVNHELLTPIYGISGMLDLLKMTEVSDEQQNYLDTMTFSVKQLTDIVKALFDYSNGDSGKALLQPKPINLKSLLALANRELSAQADSKKIEVEFDYSAHCPVHLVGDPDLIGQAYSILLGNAIKFSDEGKIECRVYCKDQNNGLHTIRIDVIDQGIGIPTSHWGRIFDPFYQVSSGLDRSHNGIGLGLTIFSQLIELMEGRFGVRSTPDVGSLFWFEIGLPSSSLITPAPSRH
jgi:PAS domain S-box-containing protein